MRMSVAIAALLAFGAAFPAAAKDINCAAGVNYEDGDIRAFIDDIAQRTGRIFIVDPRVQGKVKVTTPPNHGLCADEAWALFQSVLRVNGFVATPVAENTYRVIPVQDAVRSPGVVGVAKADPGDVVSEVVPLRYADARDVSANLSQLVSERGVVTPVRTGNSLIIVDTTENVRRMKQLLAEIDRDRTVYKTFQLTNSNAIEVARMLTSIAKQQDGEGGSSQSLSIIPVDANNSILIRAEPALLNRLSGVVSELDRLSGSRADLAVIPLANADAEDTAKLLRELVSGAAQAGAPSAASTGQPAAPALAGPQSSGRATITFHKPTNSVIINADPDLLLTLRNVIAQIDVRRPQVQVEAIIVELTDGLTKQLGVQNFVAGTNNSGIPFTTTNFTNATPSVLSLAGPTLLQTGNLPSSVDATTGTALTQAAINSLLALNGFGFGGGGTIGDTVFAAIITAVKTDRGSRILSTPSVVTLDNTEAELSVGQEIPITTGEATTNGNFANAFRQIERRDVGVILKVTPRINADHTVTMKIEQETSSVAGTVIPTSTDLITNKRRIANTALVDDGDILVIGGLLDDSTETNATKVPGLGDAPGLGRLFRNKGTTKSRRNLMVFIRPTILGDRQSAQTLTDRKIDYIKQQQFLYTGNPASTLERLIRDTAGDNSTAPAAKAGGAPAPAAVAPTSGAAAPQADGK